MKYSEIKTLRDFCQDLFSQPCWREVLSTSQTVDDFWIDNVRFISESVIDEVWTDSLIEQIKDCYDLSEVPAFVAIDWQETTDNCKEDGMGHHFNSYDGGEEEVIINGTLYHVFDNH
jgi:hypothetical protein